MHFLRKPKKIGGDLLSLDNHSKKSLDFKKVYDQNSQVEATSDAIKTIVGQYGGTITSAYSHPVDYEKPPLFSSGGVSQHQAKGEPDQPQSTDV